MIGTYRSVAKVSTAGRYCSPVEITCTWEKVAPLPITPDGSVKRSTSMPKVLLSAGLREELITPLSAMVEL